MSCTRINAEPPYTGVIRCVWCFRRPIPIQTRHVFEVLSRSDPQSSLLCRRWLAAIVSVSVSWTPNCWLRTCCLLVTNWRPLVTTVVGTRLQQWHRVSRNAWRYRRDIKLYRIGLTVHPTKYRMPEMRSIVYWVSEINKINVLGTVLGVWNNFEEYWVSEIISVYTWHYWVFEITSKNTVCLK